MVGSFLGSTPGSGLYLMTMRLALWLTFLSLAIGVITSALSMASFWMPCQFWRVDWPAAPLRRERAGVDLALVQNVFQREGRQGVALHGLVV